jgi:hypothetical protein
LSELVLRIDGYDLPVDEDVVCMYVFSILSARLRGLRLSNLLQRSLGALHELVYVLCRHGLRGEAHADEHDGVNDEAPYPGVDLKGRGAGSAVGDVSRKRFLSMTFSRPDSIGVILHAP